MGGREPLTETSSGTVDIANSYDTSAGCEGAIVETQVVTFHVDRARSDGKSFSIEGTTSSSLTLIPGQPPQAKSTSIDVTRTAKDESGAVVRSVHLTGTRAVAFSSDLPPARTVNEDLQAEFEDGAQRTVKLTDVVFPPMHACPFPISGTMVSSEPDGTTHTLVYGPTCGAATEDGTAIQLQQRDRRGPGMGGH
jgi:hypothetical protein